MANIILGFPNYLDTALLSGGNWFESLPLTNLQDRAFARVARSNGTSSTNAQLVIDLQRERYVRILAFVAHNLTLGGRIRIEASNAADFSTLLVDTSTDAWPSITDGAWATDLVEWENDNFWTGSYMQEDVEGQTAVCPVLLPNEVFTRYIRVTFDDSANPQGFIQCGRIFVGSAFLQPTINYSWGGSIAYEDATIIETALSGAEFFDRREPIRVMRFQLATMSAQEGFGKALELTRRAGTSGEIFVIADPEDSVYGGTRNFLGRLRQLSALEQISMMGPTGLMTSMSFEIKELR